MKPQLYALLKHGEEKYSDADCEEASDATPPPCSECKFHKKRTIKHAIIAYVGWSFSFFLIATLVYQRAHNHRDLDRECLIRTSAYTPLQDNYTPVRTNIRFNGSLEWPSPFRGPPTKQVDRAWNEISYLRPLDIPMTDADFLKVGRDPSTAARNAPEHRGGFFVVPEFTHQIHCVNLLRKANHFNFAHYKSFDPDFTDDTGIFKIHLDHCVEQLRQFVMCHADIGLVTAHWIEQRHKPWPDFNTLHSCRNFDEVLGWARSHQLPEGTPFMPRKPDGAKAMSAPP